MGATRDVAVTELPFRGISINSNNATIAVVASDSGVMFINKHTGADAVYTLPATADAKGKMFWFYNAQTTKNIKVNAPVNTMFMSNDLASDSALSAADCGESAFVVCDGTSYYFFEIMGTWASN